MMESVRLLARRAVVKYYGLAARTRAPYEWLLILGHMRCGSSLLVHLLVAGGEIEGFGETHTMYDRPRARDIALARCLWRRRRLWPGSHRYLMDKVLHNAELGPETLARMIDEGVKIIYMLREPTGTIGSIIRTQQYAEERALAYYVERLERLGDFSALSEGHDRPVMVTFEELLERTQPALELLGAHLGLATPLSEQYDVLPTTGRRGIGDPSENIQSGRILRDRPKAPCVELSPESIRQGRAAFEAARLRLAAVCRTV